LVSRANVCHAGPGADSVEHHPVYNVGFHVMTRSIRFLGLAFIVGNIAAATAGAAAPSFERDVAPLLAEHCHACHGARKQESGLRLDSRAAALRGGDHGPALVPGKASASALVLAVGGRHPEVARMPHRRDPLAAADVAVLTAWIDAGADWPGSGAAEAAGTVGTVGGKGASHWAFKPFTRPTPPKARATGHSIDGFVRERLAKEGVAPSPEADRATLLRRVSLDLTGLPPTPEDVDAFVSDKAPGAYERVVERLLASPHYGERWARWWLDAARYADSNGFEKDRTRSIWPWRDWVIRALNEDKPFDAFTVEQLAGDLLPGATLDQRVATGFLRNSMVNMEGGIEPEKFRVEAMIDRVDCVSRTWLGVTLACAQCHHHKYDPFTVSDYYGFYALLNQDDEPRIEIPTPEQARIRAGVEAAARAVEDKLWASLPDPEARLEAWLRDTAAAAGSWQAMDAREWHSQPMKFEKMEDLAFLGGGDIHNFSVVSLWVDVTNTHVTGFKLEALNDANLPFHGPGIDGDGGFNLCEFTVEASPLSELSSPDAGSTTFKGTTNQVPFRRAIADAWPEGAHPSLAIDGVRNKDGWHSGFTKGRRNQERRIVFEAEKPVGFPGGTRLHVALWQKPDGSGRPNHLIGRFRVSMTSADGPLPVDPLSARQRALANLPASQRTEAVRRELFREMLLHDPAFADAARAWDAAWKDWPGAEHSTLALSARPIPRTTRVFKRGDWTRPGTEVAGATPAILPPLPHDAPANRLGLARWIVDPGNPLTSRVVVNRVWQAYFGSGLVSTPEDFGVRADAPSHPALLDWLAREWVEPGPAPASRKKGTPPGVGDGVPWSLKRLHRLIVTSATYRQASRITPAMAEKDPQNRLLARGPRVRVDAEMVQDIVLKASGLLSPKVGGPSVFPPLPDGVMSLAYGQIGWNVSPGDDRYRRSMYTFWKRTVPYPAMTAFDAPAAEQSCVRRNRSNTPLQALVTLNEPTMNNAARWLGWRALQQGGASPESRATFLFRQVLGRRPDPREVAALARLASDLRDEFARREKEALAFAFNDPQNPPPLPPGATTLDVAAWAGVARAVINLDEAITKE
jgi:hypothetical protein